MSTNATNQNDINCRSQGRARLRPGRRGQDARVPRESNAPRISWQCAFIGSSFIGSTGQPDIRPSEGGRDGARPSPASLPPCTIYTFYTADYPRSVSGGIGTDRSFNPFVHGLEVGGRGRPRSRKGARFPHHVLTIDSRCGAARSESSSHLCGNQNFADVANFA